MQKTSAWPLTLVYIGLIFYASLYPFSDWRYQGIEPWAFLGAPLPKYWTGFDVAINVLGYMPLGFLWVLSALRTGRTRFAIVVAVLVAGFLSFTMESIQSFLPGRIPSNVDLALNIGGALLGGWMAWFMEKLGVIAHWSRLRARWFVEDARGALVLMALWPVALLFPATVPFGLGQVLERLEAALAEALQDTPFLQWMPLRDIELQPLVPLAELICVTLGLLIPCLLCYCIIRASVRRVQAVLLVFATGVGVTALSAALSYGPQHAWAWVSLPVKVGMVLGFVVAMLLVAVPRRGSAALALLGLGVYLSALNQAPTSSYVSQTLATWEQGRFIRFNGLAQWLGWLWPYATLAYVLTQLWGTDVEN